MPPRGELRVFFGHAPGVGTTRALLEAGRAAAAAGRAVVLGALGAHERAPEGLERLSRGPELDLDAALARRPDVLLVDELARANPAGSRHARRWQDVHELLGAGISVWTTLHLDQLESLRDVVARLTGLEVGETVPDQLLDEATGIELVDRAPDVLLARRPGLERRLSRETLCALRELALRRTADLVARQVDPARPGQERTWAARERLLVCIGPSPTSARLIRAAKRMATATHAEWIAVHVETVRLGDEDRARLAKHFALAEQLGAETVALTGDAIAEEVVRYARARQATKIVIGKTGEPRAWGLAGPSLVERVVALSGDVDVYVIRGIEEERVPEPAVSAPRSRPTTARGLLGAAGVLALSSGAAWAFSALGAPEATLVMAYLLGVIAVAGLFGRLPAVATSLAAVLLYNLLFTTPYYTVRIDDPGHLYTFAMMLLVAVAVSELTARIHARLALAREREQRFEALYRMSQRLAGVAGRAELARAAEELLSEILPGGVVVLLPGPGEPLDGRALGPAELEAARWVLEHGQPAGRGTGTLPGVEALFVPLGVSGRVAGVLAWRPGPGQGELDVEGRRLLLTLVNQLALALERDRLAEETRRVQAEAETEKVRSGLLSGLSHDLRTPLAAIAGSASALLQPAEPDPATRRQLAHTILSEAERLARFVEKVLQMTRIHAGRLEVARQWQPLDEVIGSALHRLERALGAREVRLVVPADPPLVPMDGLLIEQVLMNLIENAVSYSPPETAIEVGARTAGGSVELWVADEGPGVAPEDRERVFEVFYRSPVAGQVRSQGVGLGLAICRAIVQAHGGTIRVAPRPGPGARFELTLPLGEVPACLRQLVPAAGEPGLP